MYNELIPIIELHLRGLSQQMVCAFASRVDELKPYVEKAVSEALSPDNLQKVISKQVNEVIKQSIEQSLGSWEVRKELEKIVSDSLSKKIKQKKTK